MCSTGTASARFASTPTKRQTDRKYNQPRVAEVDLGSRRPATILEVRGRSRAHRARSSGELLSAYRNRYSGERTYPRRRPGARLPPTPGRVVIVVARTGFSKHIQRAPPMTTPNIDLADSVFYLGPGPQFPSTRTGGHPEQDQELGRLELRHDLGYWSPAAEVSFDEPLLSPHRG